MQCLHCQHDNPEGARFCNACGTTLEVACSACGHVNPSESRFCNACGHNLFDPTSQPTQPQPQQATPLEPPTAARYTPDAERRQLTVMFCDVVDSTSLSSQLDPEALREVLRAYHEASARVIARFEGHIAQYLGDGLLVYFGYPLAHEDDAQRAVRAGLGIVEALGQLNTRLEAERGVQLAVRLGIHTGLVVVGDVGEGPRHEQLALGETPNLAARLQGMAAPNTVVISAATLPLLGGFFACESLGTPPLQGLIQTIEVFQVQYESMARSRLEVVGHTGLTHMRQGLADLQVVGLEVVRPYWLSLLAAVHAMVGQVDEGLHTLDDALQTSQTNGWRVWEPELYRLKGDLVLAQSPDAHAHAETWFRHALDLASQQQAKSIELRAAMHLSRLWQQQGQRQEARELLAPIYGWFTEGFDTVDLQEAKVLLAGLA